ncbi:MAG: hypothetical protein ACK463_11745, partial [Bradyrhizobium sp.]
TGVSDRRGAASDRRSGRSRLTTAIGGAGSVCSESQGACHSSSTQMLLIVMVGALALAGLVSALVFRLTRTRTPPYEIKDEWQAPWDSLHTEPAPPMAVVSRDRPLRLSEAAPRRSET